MSLNSAAVAYQCPCVEVMTKSLEGCRGGKRLTGVAGPLELLDEEEPELRPLER